MLSEYFDNDEEMEDEADMDGFGDEDEDEEGSDDFGDEDEDDEESM